MTEKLLDNVNKANLSVLLTLPAKITGIVFWGMVLLGLLTAVYLLQVEETNLVKQYKASVLHISDNIESVFTDTNSVLRIDEVSQQVFLNAQKEYDIEAIEFSFSGKHYALGERLADQYKVSHHIHVYDAETSSYQIVDLSIYAPSLSSSISTLRKKMMLIIGALVFMFGLILQKILQKVLSSPFLNMLSVAEQFANGENHVRFDEQRKDEFGYMARFINRALDSITLHQTKLEASKKALFEEKERAEVTLHSIIDGVITTTADARIQYMNPVAERLTGWTHNRAFHMALKNVVKIANEETGELIENPVNRCLDECVVEHQVGHAVLIRYDGGTVPIEVSAAPMKDHEGRVIGAVMVLQDVSQARRLTKQLSYQASHDALTGLYNRRMFEECLQTALLNVQEEDRHHAMCYIDLDQFKIVNDTCGHVSGDELLRQIAVLLKDCVRGGDTLARLGGDEFGILLENCPLSQASRVANSIREKVREFRFGWDNKSFEIGASIGVVNISSENVDLASIMSAADVACYAAKDMGRNRVHVYEPTDAVLAERHGQMHWANRIVDALEHDHFVLYQQAEASLNPDVKTLHTEVLIRMKDEDGGLIGPDSFIPAAERYNLMHKIDRWVIRNVFETLAKNSGKGHLDRVVSINLSGMSLVDDDLFEYILQTQQRCGINFKEICFEVTETAAISNLAKATHFMHELKKVGCQFALDDFGSGLSSFGYLKNLPVDYIKIDGSFVVDMVNDPIDRAMVEAITSLGHVMKIKTIAEWVENEETLEMLREIGVDFAQGYHIGRPVEVSLFETQSI